MTPLLRSGERRIALYGTGEAAELAYLTLRELGIEPAAILDGHGGGSFLGRPVRPIEDVKRGDYSRIIVSTLQAPEAPIAELERRGISRRRLIRRQR